MRPDHSHRAVAAAMRTLWCAVLLLVVVVTATSDSDTNFDTSWHGWFTEDAPAWDSDLNCFLNADQQQCAETHAQLDELDHYRIQSSPYDAFFDGVYRPERFLHGSYNLPVWRLSSREAWELPLYLANSDYYVGYWVLASDVWSTHVYAYAYAPDVAVPSAIPAERWHPAAFRNGMRIVSVPAADDDEEQQEEEGEEDGEGDVNTLAPTVDPEPEPNVFYYPNDAGATFQMNCPAGSSAAYTAECAAWCGCSALGEPCKYCCRRDERNGWCYREDGTSAPTAQHGFVERRASGCDVMRRGDGVCDPQCNHPDFDYDDGDCCGDGGTVAQPKNCVDPREVDPEMSFRFDFNVPKCRKAVRDQGSCGSCWAFAVTTVGMDQACLAALRRHETLTWHTQSFSAQYMDSCDVFGGPASGVGMCEGGYPGFAMVAFTDTTGYRPEQCYPYRYAGDAEKHFDADVDAVTCEAAWAAGVNKGECTGAHNYMARLTARGTQQPRYATLEYTYLSPQTAHTIRYRLRHEGPMPFAFTVYGSFYTLQAGRHGPVGRGLYDASYAFGNSLGGHAVALIGYGEYTVAGERTHYWVLENSWGLPASHDRGIFYLDASVDWGETIGGYVMYHRKTLSAEQPLTVVKTLVDDIHPDTSLEHRRRLQAAMQRREGIARVRDGRRRLAFEVGGELPVLPTPHDVDAPLSIAREAGAMESADCHGAEVLIALKQAEALLTATLGVDASLIAVYVCELQITARLHARLEVEMEVSGEPFHVALDLSASPADWDELLNHTAPLRFELDALQRLTATQFANVRPRLLHPALRKRRSPPPPSSPTDDASMEGGAFLLVMHAMAMAAMYVLIAIWAHM